jgi:hypothetical protein
MSTSLKVVSMAVWFLAARRRRAIVCRMGESFFAGFGTVGGERLRRRGGCYGRRGCRSYGSFLGWGGCRLSGCGEGVGFGEAAAWPGSGHLLRRKAFFSEDASR